MPVSETALAAAGNLLTFAESGVMLGGVKERTARKILGEMGVVPVIVSPRCVRVVRAELEAAIAKLPRRTAPTEPAQLQRGKAIKRAGGA